jgi:hypothetical protein
LSGGIISLTDGTQAELRRIGMTRWRLEATDTDQRYAEFRKLGLLSGRRDISVALWPFPNSAATSILVLTALAVLRLEESIAVSQMGGG